MPIRIDVYRPAIAIGPAVASQRVPPTARTLDLPGSQEPGLINRYDAFGPGYSA
ncbi:MAG: hypothetical protein ACTIKR_14585 [Advenella sp.]|uniref:hypothetical protein n=1 Tax=Advenella sp. TaxID=1872388 RepID=UPI003F9A8CB8